MDISGFDSYDSRLILNTIINSSIDILILVVDPDYNLVLFNESWKKATYSAYAHKPERGENLFKYISRDEDKTKAERYINKALEGENFNIIEEFGDKNKFYFDVTYNPVRNKDDRIIGAAIFTKDITEKIIAQQRLEKYLELNKSLLLELRHRIKNNLSLILSIIDIESIENNSVDVMNTLLDLRCRITSIAELYDLINSLDSVTSVDMPEYLMEIFDNIKRLYRKEDIVIDETIEISEISLPPGKALPIGLIFNEILTNAYKYAFADRNTGKLLIRLVNDDEALILNVCDDGPGVPAEIITDESKRSGLGVNLIYNLSEQLEASIDVKNNNGANFILRIPF